MFGEASEVLRFYLSFCVFGVLGFPLAHKIFGSSRAAWWIAKPLGLLLAAYPLWLLASFRLVPGDSNGFLYLLLLSAAAGGAYRLYRYGTFRGVLEGLMPVLLIELASILLYLTYLFFRSFNPDLQNTEKFMDLAMLASAGKAEYFPFADPWWSEKAVNYYYYGFFLLSRLANLAGVPYALAFSLSLGLIFCQTIVLTAGLLYEITASWLTAGLGGWLTALSGSFAFTGKVLYSLAARKPLPSYASSARYYDPSYIINEIPSYSFVVGDLHPHLISLPFFLTNLHVLRAVPAEGPPNLLAIALFLMGAASSTLVNSWDGITLGLLYGILVFGKLGDRRWLAVSLGLLAGIVLLIWPFSRSFQSPVAGIGFAPYFAWINDLIQKQYPTPIELWLGLWGVYLFLIFESLWGQRKAPQPLLTSFFLTALALVLAVEVFFVRDIYHVANPPYFRANTVFKFGFHSWVLLTIAAVALARQWLGNGQGFATMAAILFANSLVFPWLGLTQYYSLTMARLTAGNTISLDGSAFWKRDVPSDWYAIQWINQNVRKRTVILEAAGDSYSNYGRMSAFTGMMCPINWKSHEWGWRFHVPKGTPLKAPKDIETGYGPVAAVAEEVSALYQSRDLEQTRSLLRKYEVGYVYIGDLERKAYPGLLEAKFLRYGHVVFTSGNSYLFAIDSAKIR